ncbi:hypothetical protein LINGRAHAP2_LOCUS22849 [Linum grandiflorum]
MDASLAWNWKVRIRGDSLGRYESTEIG